MRRLVCISAALLLCACVDPSITGDPLPPVDDPDVGDVEPDPTPDAPDASEPDPDAPEPDPNPDPTPDPVPDPVPDPTPDAEPIPARYRADTFLSPFNDFVTDRLQAIRDRSEGPDDLVFMKVGASGTVNRSLLSCFAGDPESGYVLDLDGREVLGDTVEFFRQGDAAGDTPFDRPTAAARSGQSARWAITGDPSPMDTEIAAINPRFAIVNYGTNDMQLGTTHLSALFPFYENFTALIDQLLDQGIVPILTGLNPRTDRQTASEWVPTYNAVTRGVAEALQIPYINLYLASLPLPDLGLVGDGVHGNVFRDDRGRAQPCVFTEDGLQFNYNVRNLLTLEALHHTRLASLEDAPPPDTQRDPLLGSGGPEDPFIIDRLPFTHAANTGDSPHQNIDSYPSCDNGQDESGPEFVYRLELEAATTLRMILLDRGDVDIDLHILGADGESTSCVERDNKVIERNLEAGTWFIVLDTFVGSNGTAHPGDYLLAILEP